MWCKYWFRKVKMHIKMRIKAAERISPGLLSAVNYVKCFSADVFSGIMPE